MSPGWGAGPAQKPGGGAGAGVKWPVGRLRAGKRGRPGNSKNATLPARESFFFAFLFACSLHFFGIFFAVDLNFFCIFFSFLIVNCIAVYSDWPASLS